jgi:hypothetical protein
LRVLYRWLLPVVFGALDFKSSVWCRAEGYVSGLRVLELLMMGIMMPETCWASNKICNQNHLLRLVSILFPRINDDARSKSLQIKWYVIKTFQMWDRNTFLFWVQNSNSQI